MKEPKEKKTKEPKEKKVKESIEKKVKETKEKKIKVPKEKKAKKIKDRQKWTSKYFKKFSGRASDSYDEMLHLDYDRAIERAKQLSSIMESEFDSPIVITVPDAFDKNGRVTYRLDKKEDGTSSLLYDQALVTILFFGDDSLFYYQANIDHRNGHIAFDIAGEFNYFDVVHMETALKYDNADNPKYITLDLEVGLADGTIVPFHLRNHRIHDGYDLPTLLTASEQKVLDAIKRKVRESRML
ncbi:hypothetical protein [Peloplasma aerotolerans]|uniref:Uncharacterized protein n=1 Tax=Peloplasma aerotolerans TaxID=3044389 RepID=A0AAW6UAK5_9MOLU|nr:hypothetical protein [Mariniplasma sp. M4Ah]MDI6453719.1 hypothetical protein [Mariniplasma sp. M4Ah]MDR4968191.1 hypothetical protein [Acholeplasmataceae bacterium]